MCVHPKIHISHSMLSTSQFSHVRIYLKMCVYVRVFERDCVCTYASVCARLYVCACARLCVRARMCMCVCLCACVYMFIYFVFTFVYIQLLIDIWITYTHIHIDAFHTVSQDIPISHQFLRHAPCRLKKPPSTSPPRCRPPSNSVIAC